MKKHRNRRNKRFKRYTSRDEKGCTAGCALALNTVNLGLIYSKVSQSVLNPDKFCLALIQIKMCIRTSLEDINMLYIFSSREYIKLY